MPPEMLHPDLFKVRSLECIENTQGPADQDFVLSIAIAFALKGPLGVQV